MCPKCACLPRFSSNLGCPTPSHRPVIIFHFLICLTPSWQPNLKPSTSVSLTSNIQTTRRQSYMVCIKCVTSPHFSTIIQYVQHQFCFFRNSSTSLEFNTFLSLPSLSVSICGHSVARPILPKHSRNHTSPLPKNIYWLPFTWWSKCNSPSCPSISPINILQVFPFTTALKVHGLQSYWPFSEHSLVCFLCSHRSALY